MGKRGSGEMVKKEASLLAFYFPVSPFRRFPPMGRWQS